MRLQNCINEHSHLSRFSRLGLCLPLYHQMPRTGQAESLSLKLAAPCRRALVFGLSSTSIRQTSLTALFLLIPLKASVQQTSVSTAPASTGRS
jgi:hypothetical protein